jgi:methyltransferase
LIILLVVLVFVPMVAEAVLSARHDRVLRAAGAVEPAGDVYRLMQIVYPAAFLALLTEGALRTVRADGWMAAGLLVFVASKLLKYWAIASLRTRWTFRVLVPPESTRIQRGPYRWVAHPNYLAVAGELTGIAIALHAIVTGPPAVVLFVSLMWRRVRIEENALRESRIRPT